MSGIDAIINYQANDDEDYYTILGCDEHSSIEQITAEYKNLALQYHPDKNDGNKEAEEKFQKMKEAKEVLCDPEKKAKYDKWRNSGLSVSYKQWVGMSEHSQQVMHWSVPKTKDRMLPEASSCAEGGSGTAPGKLQVGNGAVARRRASESVAQNRNNARIWGANQPNSEIVNKFRNYEI